MITEGRDQATIVFPNADVKIYLTASDEQQDMHYARPPEPQQRVQQTFCGT